MTTVRLLNPGLRDYAEILELQRQLFGKRIHDEIPDTCIVARHNPTITLGKSTLSSNPYQNDRRLERRGIQVVETSRGGDVTYHGPGQIVIYPIFDLTNYAKDVGWFVHQLEATMKATAATFSVPVERRSDHPGLWIKDEDEKIGSVGLHLKKWVSMHGLSFNVDLDEDKASLIKPCGMDGTGFASLADYCEIEFGEVQARLLQDFEQQFEISLEEEHAR